jgi:hypothetical protein
MRSRIDTINEGIMIEKTTLRKHKIKVSGNKETLIANYRTHP